MFLHVFNLAFMWVSAKSLIFNNPPGLVSEVLMRKKEMEVLANLKNIVVLDCDKDAFYKKVQSASGLPSEIVCCDCCRLL